MSIVTDFSKIELNDIIYFFNTDNNFMFYKVTKISDDKDNIVVKRQEMEMNDHSVDTYDINISDYRRGRG